MGFMIQEKANGQVSVLNDEMQTLSLEILFFLRCHHCKISFLEQENTASVQRNELITGEVEEIRSKIRAIEVYLPLT